MNRGLITCYDSAGVERTIETPDFDSWLREMRVTQREKLKNRVFSCMQGSQNRSYWFMNYMPLCGVKEQPPQGRRVNYVEWLAFSSDELAGEGFNNAVFGTGFLNGHESVYKSNSDLLDILSNRRFPCGHGIDPQQIEIVCRIMYVIWEMQLHDPMGRLVLPTRLRMEIGFMTNVSASDLTQIGSGVRLPIYILTSSKTEWEAISQYSYSVPLYSIDVQKVEQAERTSFSGEKLSLLEKLAELTSNSMMIERLDVVEKEVLKEHGITVPSFQYYSEMLEKMNSQE